MSLDQGPSAQLATRSEDGVDLTQDGVDLTQDGVDLTQNGVDLTQNGVDLTLIRWMLSMTPAERLETLQQHVRSVLRIRAENSGA